MYIIIVIYIYIHTFGYLQIYTHAWRNTDTDLCTGMRVGGHEGTQISSWAPWATEVWIPFGDHPLKLERYREN